jgi:hypothetical protein
MLSIDNTMSLFLLECNGLHRVVMLVTDFCFYCMQALNLAFSLACWIDML